MSKKEWLEKFLEHSLVLYQEDVNPSCWVQEAKSFMSNEGGRLTAFAKAFSYLERLTDDDS